MLGLIYTSLIVKCEYISKKKSKINLIKNLRSGWNAFWFNNTAKLFDLSLKSEYDPYTNKSDFYIEDILQRAFQNEQLERQSSKLVLDYYDIRSKWENN